MDSSVSPKDENWFLRLCHHISNAVYTWWSFPKVERLGLSLTNWLYILPLSRVGVLIYPLPGMPSPLGRRQLYFYEVQEFLTLKQMLKASTRNPFKRNRLACLLYQVSYQENAVDLYREGEYLIPRDTTFLIRRVCILLNKNIWRRFYPC
jgi:hypothetical protein